MDMGCGCHSHEAQGGILSRTGRGLQMVFLVSALSMAVFHSRSEAYATFAVIFGSIVLEALPFMLLGTLIGGLMEVFLSREGLIRLLPNRKYDAIILAALLGILFPVCECAIVPVVRKLLKKGMPLGSAVAFLLAGPIVNPLVFASTYTAYGFSLETAVLRVMAGFFIAIGVALVIEVCLTPARALKEDPPAHGCSLCNGIEPRWSFFQKIRAAFRHGALDFYDIGRFLIMGAFIAAALQTFIPRQAFTSLTAGPVAAIISMMVLAVALNLCSEADAFIAASFRSTGLPFSAQLAFMVLGPMLDIKLILMYLTVFRGRMILVLSSLVILFVFVSMVFLEFSGWM